MRTFNGVLLQVKNSFIFILKMENWCIGIWKCIVTSWYGFGSIQKTMSWENYVTVTVTVTSILSIWLHFEYLSIHYIQQNSFSLDSWLSFDFQSSKNSILNILENQIHVHPWESDSRAFYRFGCHSLVFTQKKF